MPKLKLRKKGGGNSPAPQPRGKNQPLWTGAGAVFPYSEALAEAFTHSSRFQDPYINYKVLGKGSSNPKIVLPRAKFPLGVEDRRTLGGDINITMQMGPKNEDQQEVIEKLDYCWHKLDKTGVLVNASTGFGKTYVGCHSIVSIGKTALVLVHKSDLEGQWRESFEKFLGLKRKHIGLVKADICDISGCPVVIGYVQSMMQDNRYPSMVYKLFGQVIADEVHLMSADKFVNCMYLLPAMYRLGLSATMDRSDQKEHVFKDHIGRTIIKAEMLPMPFVVIKVATDVSIPKGVYYKPGRMMGAYNFLANHPHRQQLITGRIKKCYNKDRNIVAFADTREHLRIAHDMLVDAGLPMNEIGFYVGHDKGKFTDADREELKRQAHKRIVLATYKMTQVGTDFPHWDTAVLMTPRSDIRQTVGRVVREMEGKKRPVVYDFVDPQRVFQSFWWKRRAWYNEYADEIVGE